MFIKKPSLKLFISLDAIGSTAYKNNNIHKDNSHFKWMKFFTKFEKETSSKILKEYNSDDSLYIPYFWKSLGDELIYVVDIRQYKDIHGHIKLFIKIIEEANKTYELKIKGSSFLAGFPITNHIITKKKSYPKHPDVNKNSKITSITEIDFLGPSIDLGFRISKYSNLDKFVITADIAMIISFFNSGSSLKFYYSGLQDTKGVLDNKYPIFWIATFKNKTLDHEIQNYIEVNQDKVCTYCKEFIFGKKYKFLPPVLLNGEEIKTDNDNNKDLAEKWQVSLNEFKSNYKEKIEKIKKYIEDPSSNSSDIDENENTDNKIKIK